MDSIVESDTLLDSNNLSILSEHLPQLFDAGSSHSSLRPVLKKDAKRTSQKELHRWIANTPSGDDLCYANVPVAPIQDESPRMVVRQSNISSSIVSPKPRASLSPKAGVPLNFGHHRHKQMLGMRDAVPRMATRRLSPLPSKPRHTSTESPKRIVSPAGSW